MNIFKKLDFYLIICFSFCVYNLSILMNNARKSVFQVSESIVNSTHISICMILDNNSYDCSKLDQKSPIYNVCLKMFNLSIFFRSNQTPKDTIMAAERNELYLFYNFGEKIKIINFFYYLNFQSICIAYFIELNQKIEIQERSYLLIPLFNHYKIESKILFHYRFPYPFITRGYFFECKQFSQCETFSITIRAYNLATLPAPFRTQCKNYVHLKFSFEKHEKIISQGHCLLECLKEKHRLSFFYYTKKDHDLLKFNLTFPTDNKIKLNYKRCLEICSNIDCFSRNFFVDGYKHEKLNYSVVRHHFKSLDYTAIPYMYQYSLVLQFFGLISLVFGTSVLTLLIKLERTYYDNQFLKNLFQFKITKILFIKKLIFLITVIIGIYFEVDYFILFINYETNLSSLLRSYTPIYPSMFSLVSCFNILTCLPPDIKLDNISLRELESLPNCELSKLTTNPVVKFENHIRELKMLNEKIIYRTIEKNYFKCFQIKISVQEPRYRSILFGTDLLINLTNINKIYLIDYKMKLDHKTREFRFGFKVKKIKREIRFQNCSRDYNYKGYVCSKYNCLDYCYNLEFIKKYKTIPFHSIIYSEYFRNNNNNLKFNLSFTYDSNIWSSCELKFKLENCDMSIITSHDRQIGDDFVKINNTLVINLLIEHVVETIILLTNSKELIFHILTLGSVLFSLSAPKLFKFLIKLSKLKFLDNRNFLFLLTTIGFGIHNYFILDDILNSELIPEFSNNFEFLRPNQQLPIVIFCTEHGVDLKNRLLTGNELNKSSSKIDKSYMFKEIIFYDLDFRKQIWKPNEKEPINMKINYFFINSYKCFEIEYFVNTEIIYSTYVYNVLEIKINDNLDRYLFTYRTDQSYNLVDYFRFEKNKSYFCNFEFMKENVEDLFQKIKNPLLLVQENLKKDDVKDYIKDIKNKFKNAYGFVSTSTPLFESDFDYEIRNDLFEDFINYVIEPDELKLPENKNFQRTYFNLLVSSNNERNLTGSDTVYIKKVFFEGELQMTNKDDYLGLIVNLLNALSIWYSLSLIDLAYKFNNLISYVKKLFHKLKNSKIENQIDENEYLVLKKTNKKTDIVLIDNDQVYYLE